MQLPQSVQEIADVIGREAALLLIGALPKAYSRDKRYPGAQRSSLVLYVPTLARMPADHKLVRILGWHNAVKLAKAFGGEIMYPASCAFLARDFLNKSIVDMVRETGAKPIVVAAHFGVSDRHVRNLVRENPPEERRAANDNNDRSKSIGRRANDKSQTAA